MHLFLADLFMGILHRRFWHVELYELESCYRHLLYLLTDADPDGIVHCQR